MSRLSPNYPKSKAHSWFAEVRGTSNFFSQHAMLLTISCAATHVRVLLFDILLPLSVVRNHIRTYSESEEASQALHHL